MDDIEKTKEEIVDILTKASVESGRIIESGWNALVAVSLKGAPEFQIREMRKAYFAGAQHLYAILMSAISPGTDDVSITDKDLAIMESVHDELQEFYNKLIKESEK